ncbi:hypothetical protein B0H10DRAFT_1957784 [Mycena sp. CBHHK59/15]|nr:hypothetical protein B0H10DRAFT_1957784 [Mycena sp. CBHHK59/15]
MPCFWETYPFHKHGPKSKQRLDYQFVSFDPIRACSNRCLGIVLTGDDVGIDINVLKECAGRPFDKVHVEEDLNHQQLRDKLSSAKRNVNTLKLKNLNTTDSLTSAREHLSDYTAVFDFIGTTQVPALHRILSKVHKEGWAIKKLRSMLQLATDGEYTARNYSQYEIDLAILLYKLGGGGAVHAMNHSIFVLPSLKTIQPHRRQHKITPSIHGLKFSDISRNISALFGSRISFDDGTELAVDVPPTRYGHTLSFDKLATECRIDYMTATDDMGGFCLEHLDGLETVKVGKDIRMVEAAVAAVRDGKVHIAHEASVGAISSYSRTNYGARPVYVASTCKKGTWKDLLQTMLTAVGPATLVAADRDGLFGGVRQ